MSIFKPVQREFSKARFPAVCLAVVGVGYILHWTLAGYVVGIGFVGVACWVWWRG